MLPYKSLEIIRLGLRSLKQHALRSLLTMLGILCGVSAVISMLAIGEGTSQETQEQFRRLGATNILLRSIKPTDVASSSGSRAIEYGLRYADAERIESTLAHVEVVVPQRRISRTVRYLHRSVRADVVGTVPWSSDLAHADLAGGRFLTELDERRQYNHCVLGSEVAAQLFGYEEPVGKAIRIDSSYYRVVGVMAQDRKSTRLNSSH